MAGPSPARRCSRTTWRARTAIRMTPGGAGMEADTDFDLMTAALEQSEKSYREGGLPIGAVMVEAGRIVARGHNKRVQEGVTTAHGEMDCLRSAGRRRRHDTV